MKPPVRAFYFHNQISRLIHGSEDDSFDELGIIANDISASSHWEYYPIIVKDLGEHWFFYRIRKSNEKAQFIAFHSGLHVFVMLPSFAIPNNGHTLQYHQKQINQIMTYDIVCLLNTISNNHECDVFIASDDVSFLETESQEEQKEETNKSMSLSSLFQAEERNSHWAKEMIFALLLERSQNREEESQAYAQLARWMMGRGDSCIIILERLDKHYLKLSINQNYYFERIDNLSVSIKRFFENILQKDILPGIKNRFLIDNLNACPEIILPHLFLFTDEDLFSVLSVKAKEVIYLSMEVGDNDFFIRYLCLMVSNHVIDLFDKIFCSDLINYIRKNFDFFNMEFISLYQSSSLEQIQDCVSFYFMSVFEQGKETEEESRVGLISQEGVEFLCELIRVSDLHLLEGRKLFVNCLFCLGEQSLNNLVVSTIRELFDSMEDDDLPCIGVSQLTPKMKRLLLNIGCEKFYQDSFEEDCLYYGGERKEFSSKKKKNNKNKKKKNTNKTTNRLSLLDKLRSRELFPDGCENQKNIRSLYYDLKQCFFNEEVFSRNLDQVHSQEFASWLNEYVPNSLMSPTKTLPRFAMIALESGGHQLLSLLFSLDEVADSISKEVVSLALLSALYHKQRHSVNILLNNGASLDRSIAGIHFMLPWVMSYYDDAPDFCLKVIEKLVENGDNPVAPVLLVNEGGSEGLSSYRVHPLVYAIFMKDKSLIKFFLKNIPRMINFPVNLYLLAVKCQLGMEFINEHFSLWKPSKNKGSDNLGCMFDLCDLYLERLESFFYNKNCFLNFSLVPRMTKLNYFYKLSMMVLLSDHDLKKTYCLIDEMICVFEGILNDQPDLSMGDKHYLLIGALNTANFDIFIEILEKLLSSRGGFDVNYKNERYSALNAILMHIKKGSGFDSKSYALFLYEMLNHGVSILPSKINDEWLRFVLRTFESGGFRLEQSSLEESDSKVEITGEDEDGSFIYDNMHFPLLSSMYLRFILSGVYKRTERFEAFSDRVFINYQSRFETSLENFNDFISKYVTLKNEILHFSLTATSDVLKFIGAFYNENYSQIYYFLNSLSVEEVVNARDTTLGNSVLHLAMTSNNMHLIMRCLNYYIDHGLSLQHFNLQYKSPLLIFLDNADVSDEDFVKLVCVSFLRNSQELMTIEWMLLYLCWVNLEIGLDENQTFRKKGYIFCEAWFEFRQSLNSFSSSAELFEEISGVLDQERKLNNLHSDVLKKVKNVCKAVSEGTSQFEFFQTASDGQDFSEPFSDAVISFGST
ncbi:MAG: hypothetical protein ACE365_07830 [Gammaproteobacteria bacterium]